MKQDEDVGRGGEDVMKTGKRDIAYGALGRAEKTAC